MDFGATICKPKLPLCDVCVLNQHCGARLQNLVNVLPFKEKKLTKKIRWFYYLLIDYNGSRYVRKRGPKDIWENLYEFVLIENTRNLEADKFRDFEVVQTLFIDNTFEVLSISDVYKQQLTHQTIYGQFIKIRIDKPLVNDQYEALTTEEISKLPFPKLITSFLKDKNVSLNLF